MKLPHLPDAQCLWGGKLSPETPLSEPRIQVRRFTPPLRGLEREATPPRGLLHTRHVLTCTRCLQGHHTKPGEPPASECPCPDVWPQPPQASPHLLLLAPLPQAPAVW